jgi:hypothetical protein
MVNNFVKYIVITYILLWVMFYTLLTNIQKKAIKYTISCMGVLDTTSPLKTKLIIVLNILKIPFQPRTFDPVLEGTIYTTYVYAKYLRLGNQMNNKIYWNKIFVENDINHPTLIQYKEKGILHKVNAIDEHATYIQKPIVGALGVNVKKIKGSEIDELMKYNDNILVQDLLYDCIFKNARHFRYVTLYNGERFVLWELFMAKKQSIASNLGNGGDIKLCPDFKCDINAISQFRIEDMMQKLAQLHEDNYSKILAIGWDIMLHCDEEKVISYCLEGNIFAMIWPNTIQEKDNKIIQDYLKIADKFYKANNL